MDEQVSLNHTKWECKYHVVFLPKCRRRVLYKELRRYLGEVLRRLAEQKESRIEEGHLMPDHVHMMIAIPPKHAVSQDGALVSGHRQGGPGKAAPRERRRIAALSGSHPKAPGFAGGYLLAHCSTTGCIWGPTPPN